MTAALALLSSIINKLQFKNKKMDIKKNHKLPEDSNVRHKEKIANMLHGSPTNKTQVFNKIIIMENCDTTFSLAVYLVNSV